MRTAIWLCTFLVVFAVIDAQDKSGVDCKDVMCDWPRCGAGYRAVTLEGNCCPSCERCPARPCPLIGCRYGTIPSHAPCGCPVCAPPPETEATPSATAETVAPTTAQTECDIEGQVFKQCGTACPSICGEDPPFICTLQCVVGCQCPGGMSLDRNTNRCVEECPTTAATTIPQTTTSSECDIEGQVFTECGTACPLVCGEDSPSFCTLQCVAGCQCPGGMSLDRNSNRCVDECPTTTARPTTTSSSEETTGSTHHASTHPTGTGSTTTDRLTRPGRPSRPSTGKPNTATTMVPTKPGTNTNRPPRPSTERPNSPTTMGPTDPTTTSERPTRPSRPSRPHSRPTRPFVTTEIPTTEPPKTTDRIETIPTKPTTPFGRPKPTTENLLVDGTLPPPKAAASSVIQVTENSKPVCTIAKDRGTPCMGRPVRRYYYDAQRQKCKVFAYGGCGGNTNRFNSLKDCETACSSG